MHLLPPTFLSLLYLTLTSAAASPAPPFISSDFAMSLVPRNTLFYRQMKDLQTFDQALGGVKASSIMNSGIPDRPFAVDGNNFPDFASAAQRSCDEQFQGCQQMANSQGNGNNNNNNNNNNGGDGKGKRKEKSSDDGSGAELTVNMCDQQKGVYSRGWRGT